MIAANLYHPDCHHHPHLLPRLQVLPLQFALYPAKHSNPSCLKKGHSTQVMCPLDYGLHVLLKLLVCYINVCMDTHI